MSAEEHSEPQAEAAPEAAPERPKKRKKGKKGKAREVAAPVASAAVEDGTGASKPAAALPGAGTSAGEKLREAHRAFEVGDYARVRTRTRELQTAADPAVREAAADLAARIAVDPVQIVVVLACAAVLAAIVYVWVL